MAEHNDKIFLSKAEEKVFDKKHQQTIQFNIGRYNQAVKKGLQQYDDHELAKNRAAYLKTKTLEYLDEFLLEFEKNFEKNGGKVIWAETAETALQEIQKIFRKHRVRTTVKSKSMVTEEIDLNAYLEAQGTEVFETDLGEYIVQLAEQKPYHIVTPAMHMSKKDISDLFSEKLHIQPTDDAEELAHTARKLLREKYLQSRIGITGGNFLIADVGGVAITENEGNARLSTAFPRVHIAIVGIEKIIPKMTQLDLFWSLLSTSGTGQKVTAYNTIFTGPKKAEETDGPEEMYVVLLDNGRSKLLADTEKRQALNCIRCGACLNVCPVYKSIGGHTYGTTYSGPIGSVISPHYNGFKEFKHLSQASSLCGACTEVCPVKIDIQQLLLLNRKESADRKMNPLKERIGFYFWQYGMLKRSRMNWPGKRLKQILTRKLFGKVWEKRRAPLQFAKKTFNQQWKKKIK